MTNFPWLFSVNQTLKTTYYCLKSNYIPFRPCQWLFEIVQCEWKFLSNVNMWYSLKLSKEHRGYPRNIYLLGKIVISLNYKFHSEASIIFKYWINRKKILQTPKYCMWLLLVRKRNLLDSGRVFSISWGTSQISLFCLLFERSKKNFARNVNSVDCCL